VSATEQQRGHSRHSPNSAFDVMGPAKSAGGLKNRSYVLPGLPTDFPASVLVVRRPCPDHPSLLADILGRRTALMVKQTMDGDMLRPATGFTPVPDRHPQARPDGTVSQATRVPFVRPLSDIAFALRTLAGGLGEW
jgi:two-component system chemotaxis response regulator CheB